MTTHFQILIIGGGNAGISLASQLLRKDFSLQIALVDPAEKHYYQPAWTLVGGGAFDVQSTVRNQADVMPSNVTWIKEKALSFDPENNKVHTSGSTITYDVLAVCPGIQLDWHKIKGLPETLGKNGVCSNYGFDKAPYTWQCIQEFKGGTAIFHAPGTPIKCGGAPQKIMYLAADYWRKQGLLSSSKVLFNTAGGVIFGVKEFADTLLQVVKRYGIILNFQHNLIEIDGDKKEATFEVTKNGNIEIQKFSFDMLHVVPPQSAPDFIKNSPLAMLGNPLGWIDVDKYTLRHVRYDNIFGLGDATNTPNAKTGAAIRKQVPVVVTNILITLGKQAGDFAQYNGYGSCPLVTGYGKLVLAEFDYDNKPQMSFPIDQTKERWSMWVMKKYLLPWLYWHKILKGTA